MPRGPARKGGAKGLSLCNFSTGCQSTPGGSKMTTPVFDPAYERHIHVTPGAPAELSLPLDAPRL